MHKRRKRIINKDEKSINQELNKYKTLVREGKEKSINYEHLIGSLNRLLLRIKVHNAKVNDGETEEAQKRFNYYYAMIKRIESSKVNMDKVRVYKKAIPLTPNTFIDGYEYFELDERTPDDFPSRENEIRKSTIFQQKEVNSPDILPITYPDDILKVSVHREGTAKLIQVSVYERDAEARRKCINHYGFGCVVCGTNLEKIYGKIGANYIHVHHLIPISSIGQEYTIDPVRDLRPVCPNCHAMLHRKNPPYSVEELASIIGN